MPLSAEDRRWLRAAISLGRRGLGQVWPNPAVGCVIVQNGRVAGRGWTQPGGRPHAETMALAQAGERAKGATAYVSLEPCAHHGKTPPCAEALVRAKISRVVAPMEDPDPRVAGKGFGALRAAGITVDTGELSDEAAEANIGFLTRQRLGRPFVTLKIASTLDGRIATADGESRWITGPEARRCVHLMRAAHDGVFVGAGTARADDPLLDVRLASLTDRRPVRLVLDPRLELPENSRLALSSDDAPVWRICRQSVGAPSWGEAIPCPTGVAGDFDLAALLSALGQRGLTRILCEGGGGLAGSLIANGLADEIHWMNAGGAIGDDGTPSVRGLKLKKLNAMRRYRLMRTEILGSDLLSVWRA